MIRILPILCALLSFALPAMAQVLGPRNEDSRLTFDRINGIYTYSWSGRSNIVYRIQYTGDLGTLLNPATWLYYPGIVIGGATTAELNVQTDAPRLFMRLEVAADTDGDGMSDAWEIARGLNPNNPTDAAADADADGFTNLEEFIFGLNTSSNDFASGARTQIYTYDNANQLTAVNANLVEGFGYDFEGNLTTSQ